MKAEAWFVLSVFCCGACFGLFFVHLDAERWGMCALMVVGGLLNAANAKSWWRFVGETT